ncbi:MAG TPA: hypothetical protein V6D19_08780 [Stenomitos sp.]
MNSDTVMNVFQKGFRVTLGATSALVESIQDPIKREENLAQLRQNPNDLLDQLEEKGAVTEVEARRFVDGVVGQYGNTSATTPSSTPVTPSIDPTLQRELQELTAQLATLRAQLIEGLDTNRS